MFFPIELQFDWSLYIWKHSMSGMSRLNLLPPLEFAAWSRFQSCVWGLYIWNHSIWKRSPSVRFFYYGTQCMKLLLEFVQGLYIWKKQHFDGVATNSFLSTRVKCELSASILNWFICGFQSVLRFCLVLLHARQKVFVWQESKVAC